MNILLVGLGIQGKKRLKYFSDKDKVISYDPFNKKADFQNIDDIDLKKIKVVFICTPINQKEDLINLFIKNNINIFIEKPALINLKKLKDLKNKLYKKKLSFYTAYNHRFEPNIIHAKKELMKKGIGKIYLIDGIYGNGTARDIRNSIWKDTKKGIIYDLGSHLVDILIYLIDIKDTKFYTTKNLSFENKYEDYYEIACKYKDICINLKTSYLSWKNKFNINIYGSKGSIHITGLCKWGESSIEIHRRKLPSGKPKIIKKIYNQEDPTWMKELNFFRKALKNKKNFIERDILLSSLIDKV